MPDRIKTALRWASNIAWVALIVGLFFADTDGAVYSFYKGWVHPALIVYLVVSLSWKVIEYDLKGWRKKGWRGLFPVRMAEFLWMILSVITYMTLYYAGSMLIRAVGVFFHRVLLSPENSKWAWVQGIQDQPLDKRSEGFWEDSVSSYKWYIRWDHEEAQKAVDYYRMLTKRRREWKAQFAPALPAHEGGGEA